MTKLPIDLPMRTMTAKVSVGAHERLKALAEKHGFLIQDVLSACLLHMPEVQLVELLKTQKERVDALPKAVRGMLRNLEKLSDAERAMLRDILGPDEK
jgi:hypothetical protein